MAKKKKITFLDSMFEPTGKNEIPEKKPFVKMHQELNNKGVVTNTLYEVVGEDKTVVLSQSHYSKLKKIKSLHADKILKNAKQEVYKESKVIFQSLALAGIVIAIAAGGLFYFLNQNKNYSEDLISFENNEDIELGNFVETDSYYLDGIEIEITETSTTYGVETGSEVKAGNTYLLVSHDEDESLETYVVKYDPASEQGKKIEEQFDKQYNSEENIDAEFVDIYLEDIKGEVKPLDDIESLDIDTSSINIFSGPTQILPIFKETIESYNASFELELSTIEGSEDIDLSSFLLEEPKFLIDNTITQVNLLTAVVLPTAAVGAIAVAVLGVAFAKWKQESNRVMEEAKALMGTTDTQKSSSVIEK